MCAHGAVDQPLEHGSRKTNGQRGIGLTEEHGFVLEKPA
jgi:hypothetical protein